MYIVSFERVDHQPKEQYYYPTLEDATFHLNLFKNDDSGLYSNIDLIDVSSNNHKIVKTLVFD